MKPIEQITLLNSWQPHISNAMKEVHNRFQVDTKFILTESDLKCWLFYELQNQKPYIQYAVHTEVTHYAEHHFNEEIVVKKHKFRDLSLLCPWLIKDNEEIWLDQVTEITLSKGFKHKGPAYSF